jgi:coproporphyrinogen III oxidase-like Fe-S oxidoreductase
MLEKKTIQENLMRKKNINSLFENKINYLKVDRDYNEINIVSFKRSFSKLQTNYDTKVIKESDGSLTLKKGGRNVFSKNKNAI